MKPGRLERAYALAVRLYPARFRAAYGAAMLQAFRDARAARSLARAEFARTILRDLAVSLAKEHLAMLREAFGRPALLFNAVVLAGISTILALALYAIPQQVLRQGANDPQIAMASDLAVYLNQYGVNDGLRQGALTIRGGAIVDMANSLSPFLIVYDDEGRALGSTGQFDGKAPAPPNGVFDYVRSHGEDRISWQPRHNVRIAAVVVRVKGSQPGFILAGRSLREVEARESQVSQMAGLAWIGMLGLILFGTAAFAWITRPETA
jgi:hypothetical protein